MRERSSLEVTVYLAEVTCWHTRTLPFFIFNADYLTDTQIFHIKLDVF